MKKNLLAILLLSSAMFVGLNNVNAQESFDLNQKSYELKSADKWGVKNIPYFGNSLIIGERIYTLDSYYVSVAEVTSSVDAYRDSHSTGDTPLYYLSGDGNNITAIYEITSYGFDKDGQLQLGERKDVTSVYSDSKMGKVTAINNVLVDTTAEDIIKKDEEEVNKKLEELITDLSTTGIENVKFENRKLTVTVGADALDTKLTNAREKVKDTILKFLEKDASIIGVDSISYNGTTIKLSALDDNAINEFAKKLLKDLSGKDDAKDLTYNDIANKSTTIQVTYIKDRIDLGTIDYIISFEYNVEKIVEKNETELQKDVKELNEEQVLKSVFSKIDYSNDTLTFEIKNAETSITSLNDTKIIDMFLKNYKHAKTIKVETNNKTETFEVPTDTELTSDQVYTWIIKVLEDMSGKTILTEPVSMFAAIAANDNTILLSDLINKEATATVTYDVNGQTATQTYTLKFTPDYSKVDEQIKTVKDSMQEIVKTAKEKIGNNKGISTVELNDTTVTFKIKDGSQSATNFSNLGLTQIISGMFAGAKKVKYTIKNVINDSIIKTIESQEKTFHDTNKEKEISALAEELKTNLTSANYYDDRNHFELRNYTNCTIDVTVTYEVEGLEKPQDYKIKFEKDTEYTDNSVVSE